ncbi:Nucleolar GTP-binding protein 2 [Echinococcus granulosus]|uniref:Nucleolar GTP-binding protein 2 n=1 Tax=Echinococcus granulosus TaxID=6210 RepID=U6JB35_ECHGR|nr:Nucleolar GTP-binding protein [Echinococcus granulosus]EUB54386.1 Nucleolar GTP-binding protein [Echinococcus granulosus]KAH9278677.1 Nucleolar GTP-binding protein 2 [Echinococcus granulosus]CDS21309.1 GTP binding protein [Echinococcus granulosus]
MGPPRKKDRVNKGKHSLNPDRGKQEKGSTMRTKSTIKRLNMYRNFKAKRDKKGHIIRAAPFQSTVASGTVSRVEPNRRWFGNTRVISQDSLQAFKEAMKIKNPYEIMLRQTRLPISLLDEKKVKKKPDILAAESFAYVFGKKARRKRPHLACDNLSSLVRKAEKNRRNYLQEKDCNLQRDNNGVRDLTSDPHFKAGSSKRLWNELFKVIDSSDVVLYVLDARDPMGTRSRYIEQYMKKEKPNKHLIFVINKVDLVPVWITKRWKTILSAEHPTLVFYANLTKPLGKTALMSLLRQLAGFHAKDRHQISVGIIGYPNVGKSSIINAMRSKRVCKVAPVAGETKVWQYVTLLKSIYLIDCPGVVYPDGDTEAEMVMKGVVRVEYLKQPEMYIPEVLERVKPEFMQQRYGLPNFDPTCHPLFTESVSEQNTAEMVAASAIEYSPTARWPVDANLFLELVAKKTGKLLKGSEPDIITTAKRVLNDFQRGKLPYFVKPPPLENDSNGVSGVANTDSASATKGDQGEATPREDTLEQAFIDAFDAEPEAEHNEENVEEETSKEEETANEEESEIECVDEAGAGGINLLPNSEDEAEAAAEEEAAASLKGLSAARKRQLERALRRKAGRAGRHYYEEVNVKNRKRRSGGGKK